MGVKYVKDFEFSPASGFHGSNKMPAKARASERGMPKMVKKAEGGLTDLSMKENIGTSDQRVPFLQRGPGGSRVRRPLDRMMREERKAMPVRRMMEEAAQRRQMADRPVEAEPMMRRPMMEEEMMRRPVAPMRGAMMKKGGKVTGEKAQKKVGKVMREFKEGKLHSGKDGPKVKNPKQAMAIALSEARSMKKAEGGEVKKPKKEEAKKPKMKIEDEALKKMRHAEKYAPGMDLDNIHDYEIKKEMKESKKVQNYAKGGKVHSDVKMDKAMMKKAVHKHEKAMHPGKPLTKLKHGGLPVHQGSPMYGKK